MRITHLILTDFRSYEAVQVDFGPGVTTLVGRNGHGKTNVVEAVRYLSTLSSHRVATDAPMLRSGAQRAILSGRVQRGDRSLTLEVTMVPGKANQARLNRGNAKPRDLVGILRTVVFAPEDLALVKGDPGTRRAFMDELCVALQPPLVGDLADYDRVLRQRSSLLKSARGKPRFDVSTLDVWDEKLADLGARIMHARLAAMEALAPHVAQAYADVAPGEGTCTITHATTVQVPIEDADTADADRAQPTAAPTAATPIADIGAALLGSMVERRSQEIERGVCLVGPHRDDLEIRIGTLPAKGYASHGESWSCALALRLGSFALLAEDGDDGEPVLILDDVFAELDSGRRAALAGRVVGAGQVLITAAVSEDVPGQLRDHPQGHRILHVTPGRVTDPSAEVSK
ncbi:MAG: DNA replication/repair protein RecF [Actinobacteria bacterium HGW-Actinobacteria-8]|nr:MAG: DNA replication/repair protein RecF [Actinobacteria bacterium HGW-Actinobacteria-8]